LLAWRNHAAAAVGERLRRAFYQRSRLGAPMGARLRCVSTKGSADMVRVFMLYESEPDPERYERHAELCRRVPGGTFRHGNVFGAPMGEPAYAYYAEWEFPDRDAFKEAARTEEFMATGKDAMEMGGRFHVLFADVA
jgi:hypothetical protein